MDLLDWMLLLLSLLSAYFLGSVPVSVWIGKIFFNKDVRNEGSGNAGATNTFRVLGWKAGVPVFILDVAKGWFALYIIHFLPQEAINDIGYYTLSVMLAIAVVLGHVYPIFAGFRGGKGVATLLGVGIALFPLSGLITFGVFTLVFLLSGYVSLSSVSASIAFPIISYFLFGNTELPLLILSVAVAFFVPITHAKNIKRLMAGTESRFLYKKKK